MNEMWNKYGKLLVEYALFLKKGETVYVSSTDLATPLLKEFYKEALKVGAHVYFNTSFEDQEEIYFENASDEQLKHISPFKKEAFEHFDAYLYIISPYKTSAENTIDLARKGIAMEASKPLNTAYMKRTGSGDMKRSLCLFPTEAGAKEAGMSLEEYQEFVFNACFLNDANPTERWKKLGAKQQGIADLLNQKETIQYKGENIDLTFSAKGRIWVNSDGKSNMPSGEVFTSPVEDSVNGWVKFTVPSQHNGNRVEGVSLEIKDGEVQKWDAVIGKEVLDQVFDLPGTRFFGEMAIGTNTNIQQTTMNILFDEKIGGTVHMAIGQSYYHTGGKNESSIHWDMITDMKKDGEIYADGELIYEKGEFII